MKDIKSITPRDYSKRDLQKVSFRNEELEYTRFAGSDLRGADFTGADLTGADLTQVRTGIPTAPVVWIFLAALAISLLSGYFAALTGRTVQTMLASSDKNIKSAGILSIVMSILFILYTYWKGGSNAIRHLIIPASIFALLTGIAAYISGLGTGLGMLYLLLFFFLFVIMFIVGTIARAAAGSLSNILFVVVALGGGMFGKSIGGGIGSVIMAIGCAVISKRALSGANGFDFLQSIAFAITIRFGTSFRKAKLGNADFSNARIHNADFTNAEITTVNWGKSKKINCIIRSMQSNKI